jgi:hypothetical protein
MGRHEAAVALNGPSYGLLMNRPSGPSRGLIMGRHVALNGPSLRPPSAFTAPSYGPINGPSVNLLLGRLAGR